LYKNPAASVDERVQDLLSRMTLEDKAGQWVNAAPAIDRLDVPAYDWWSEALHGVARAGHATVFPQAIGLAATWDVPLIERIGSAISDEARAKHHDFVRKNQRGQYQGLSFWSPNINLLRDPRWGRGMETFGEDPFLTGKIGAAFIRGLQGNDPRYRKVIGTMKHFAVHSGPEPERHSVDVKPSERDLRESYLPHFRMCVEESHVQSVMCAYNRYAGDPCCGSNTLLQNILRDEWGFDGYVTSDCGAIGDIYTGHKVVKDVAEATALAIRAGTDLNCAFGDAAPAEAVRRGLLTEAELDRSIARLFRARFELGMFDPPDMVPYTSIPIAVVGSAAHRRLALEAARKSIVLLKNNGNILPFSRPPGKVAVSGPNADDVLSLLGNYYGTPEGAVTPLAGIRKRAGHQTKVLHAPGTRFAEGVPLLQVIEPRYLSHGTPQGTARGLAAEYFRGRGAGKSFAKPLVDSSVNFTWCTELPLDCADSAHFTARWSGFLMPPATGLYTLGTLGFRSHTITVGDSVVSESPGASENPITGSIFLLRGTSYPFSLEGTCRVSGSLVRLLWEIPDTTVEDEAIAVAEKADMVIFTLGLSPGLEGEEMGVSVPGFSGGDRTDIALPDPQRRLLKKICALGKPVVLVLLNGSALAITEIKHVAAAVELWYPGQDGGTALAEVLYGDVNPSGRLPVTFYASTADLPPFADYAMKGRTYRYFEGTPLFPFGHGLSYTEFAYENLRVVPGIAHTTSRDTLAATVEITNTGQREGEEVVQLYVRAAESTIARPLKDLRGFQRVRLLPGERRTLSFRTKIADLAIFDTAQEGWRVEGGIYEILVGSSSADIRATARIALKE
jgi:beta-glucosidase